MLVRNPLWEQCQQRKEGKGLQGTCGRRINIEGELKEDEGAKEDICIIETLHGGHVGCDGGGVMDTTVGA